MTARQPVRPAAGGAGFFTKAFIWLLLLALGAIVGGAYLLKGEDGRPLAETFIHLAKVKFKMEPPKPAAPPAPKVEDDPKFKEIVAARESAKGFLDKASNPVGDLTPDTAAGLEKQIDVLAKNADDLAALSAKYPGTGLEVAAHAKLQKELASTLATVKVALEKATAASAAEAAKKATPAVVEYDLGKINPWAGRAANAWVRWKKTAGAVVTYEDEVLQPNGAVAVYGFAGQAPFRLPDRFPSGGKAKVAREESVKVGDQDVPCAVVENGATFWIPKSGPGANRIAVKCAAGDQTCAVTAIGEEEVPVKGEARKCLRFERNGLTYWAHDDVPGFHVKIQGDGLLSEVVDWGTGDRPEFPRPPKAAEVDGPAFETLKRAHPWNAAKVGMWTRRRAEYQSPLANSDTAVDATVLDVAEREITLRIETLGLDGQVRVVEQKTPFATPGSKVVGEETLTIGTTPYPCAILEVPSEAGPIKMWLAKDGRAGLVGAVLKLESMTSARQATAVDETALRIGRHDVKCLHVTSEGRRDDNAMKEEVWLSEEVPGIEARRETVQQTAVGAARSTTALLDYGDIPARKTAIGFQKEDPARLEEQRLLKVIDDAEQLVIGASVGYRDLSAAAKDLPGDPARLRELWKLADEVAAQLSKAKEAYASVRERAPQAARVDETLGKIDRALASLQKLRETIQAKLK